MEQEIEELSGDDQARLDKHRQWLLGHYEKDPEGSYVGYAAKLVLVDIILESRWVLPGETWKLQSLGVALGDALAEYLELRWMAVEDEYGRTPALIGEVANMRVFPLTMISKRVEQGEDVSCKELFKSVVDEVRNLMQLVGN